MGFWAKYEAARLHPAIFVRETIQFFDQDHRVYNNPVTDDTDCLVLQNPARDEVQYGLFALDNQGVAGVISTLEANDSIDTTGQVVNHLPLAFITPLGSNYDDIRHATRSIRTRLANAA